MKENKQEIDNLSVEDLDLYVFGPFVLDPVLRVVRQQARILPLTGKELAILLALVKHSGEVLGKKELQDQVWGGDEIGDSTLPTHIKNLRKKLGKDENGGEFVKAEFGNGYRLAALVGRERRPGVLPEATIESSNFQVAESHATTGRVQRVRLTRRLLVLTGLVLLVAAAAVLFAVQFSSIGPGIEPYPSFGRLLPRSTSEGWHAQQISLSHRPSYLAISPRGDKLFATDDHGHTLSIISTLNNSVSTLTLPQDSGPLAVSRNGKLYIGSSVEGIMVVDVDTSQLRPDIIPTRGAITGMAITPDGGKLFLAMGVKGLKRFSTGARKLQQVSDRVCPEYVAVDRQGQRLYVAYQCSGPKGSKGHDSVEIVDAEKEDSLGIVAGLPMVGGQPFVSPDGKLAMLDGADACSAQQYNQRGCPFVPSRVAYLLRPSDSQILHNFEFPVGSSPAGFLDNRRFMLLGNQISVVDASRYSVLERWNDVEDCDATDIVFTPDGRRAYVGCGRKNVILVLQRETAACSPALPGLAMLYSGDGATEDSTGVTELTSDGKLQFKPGRIGQAFFLDGANYLSTSWTGSYQFGRHDSTLALYAKFAGIEGEMVLVDWTSENPRRGIRVLKSARTRFVFQSWPDGREVESKTAVRPDAWYHLVITGTGKDLTLYVNGQPESHGVAHPPLDGLLHPPLFLGVRSPGIPSFHGWLDEIAFYNHALTTKEVKDLYQIRESGPCKL